MDMSIGERIRIKRKEMNITQTQIQDKTGISSGNLSTIESGKTLPSATALINLSKILNCSIDWILTGSSPISENLSLTNTEQQLVSNFRILSAEDQDEIVEIINIKIRKTQRKREITSSHLTNTNKDDMVG